MDDFLFSRTEIIALRLQNLQLKKENDELRAKMVKIQANLSQGNVFVYQMKMALHNADDRFKQAVTLFDDVHMPEPIPGNVFTIAQLYKIGRSVADMAEAILGSRTKKSSMHRMLQQAKNDYPHLFTKEAAALIDGN